jgi:GntR family transcriptional regulator/MocR family aminotransferase
MSRPLFSAAILELGIDRRDKAHLQAQLARQLRSLVLMGRLKPQAKLPSSRALSSELGIARATVVDVYVQLISEGFLETRRGWGTQVAAQLPEAVLTPPKSPNSPAPRPGIAKPVRNTALPFRTGLVDWESFPHAAWAKLLGKAWRNPAPALLTHEDAFGWPPLRAAIARHLFEWRGLACEPENVIVTGGIVNALDLIGRALLSKGDRVWVEEPGYPIARNVLAGLGAKPVPVAIDEEGLSIRYGLRKAPDARLAFVTPARHYPTGVITQLSRRLELLEWAKSANATIIEDDYDSEYRYVGRPLPALMSLDQRGRVISMGSFSKVFLPALRLGFLVVPEKLIVRFREERALHGTSPSLIAQPALAEFMNAGLFGTHIRRMRRIYASRRKALLSALAPGDGRLYTIDAAPSGLTLLLRLKPDQDDKAIVRRLEQAGIETQPLSGHFAGRGSDQGLLLGFAGFDEAELQRAAKRLLGELSKC